MLKMVMSKTMGKFLDDLHQAEFGYRYNEPVPLYPRENPEKMVALLQKGLQYKTLKTLTPIAIYLGYECDDRIETVDGCKSIIRENIQSWKHEIRRV